MEYYIIFITFLVIIKFIYITFFMGSLYKQFILKTDNLFGIDIDSWTDKMEFIYIFMMALLIIYLFRGAFTSNKVCIYDKSASQSLLYFGMFLLFILHWREFFGYKEKKEVVFN